MLSSSPIVFAIILRAQLPSTDDVPRLWPQPASVTYNMNTNLHRTDDDIDDGAAITDTDLTLDAKTFKMTASKTTAPSDILTWNMNFYTADIFSRQSTQSPSRTTNTSAAPLSSLVVEVAGTGTGAGTDALEVYPTLGMDESYMLSLASPVSTLTAPTVWGAVRGLETFSQLLQMNGKYVIQGGAGMVRALYILRSLASMHHGYTSYTVLQ